MLRKQRALWTAFTLKFRAAAREAPSHTYTVRRKNVLPYFAVADGPHETLVAMSGKPKPRGATPDFHALSSKLFAW